MAVEAKTLAELPLASDRPVSSQLSGREGGFDAREALPRPTKRAWGACLQAPPSLLWPVQVVLYFWATWCAPCKQMDLVVDQLAKDHAHVSFFKVGGLCLRLHGWIDLGLWRGGAPPDLLVLVCILAVPERLCSNGVSALCCSSVCACVCMPVYQPCLRGVLCACCGPAGGGGGCR